MRAHRFALQRATRDGLTDLPNQRAFQDEFPQAVATAGRHQEPVTLAVLDVDDFKHINDRHGHPHGDAILRQVASILRDGRAGDRAYRNGGDEFAAIFSHSDSDAARMLTRRLRRAFAEQGLKISIGIATLRPGESADVLQAEADAALYEAKRLGGDRSVHFDDVREQIVVTSNDRKDAVRYMIEQRGLATVFQPIIDLDTGATIAVEALTRPNEKYDLSGPAEAFDIAEQIGRVHDLDVLCVNTALAHTSELDSDTLLFLNLHPQTLDLDADQNQWLLEAIRAAEQDIDKTVIEVTERFGGRASSVTKCLQLLRGHGIKLALDDVGTGNSGLEMLRFVQAEYVKIDGGIVAAAPTDHNARAVLMAMATYARQTGAYVIAEGIEDDETLLFLQQIESAQLNELPTKLIQGGQGFSLARPAPLATRSIAASRVLLPR
jgi:diguanylate cyclase (GGDEF)-like protein